MLLPFHMKRYLYILHLDAEPLAFSAVFLLKNLQLGFHADSGFDSGVLGLRTQRLDGHETGVVRDIGSNGLDGLVRLVHRKGGLLRVLLLLVKLLLFIWFCS